MCPTRRERQREATYREIMDVAQQQIAERGAAALSLRAIARQMGMTAPAIYRYFENRDGLVTALIAQAYHSLADTMEAARDSYPPEALADRFLAIGLAYRDWAVAHPQDYVLILGTAIPGYHAPEEITLPPAMRGFSVVIDLLETAREAGKLNLPPEYAELAHELQQMLGEWRREYDIAAPEPVLHLALVVWGQLHGLVSLEIFNQLQPVGSDPGALYRFEVMAIIKRLLIE